MDIFINPAYAQGTAAPNPFGFFIPMVVIFVAFYFLMIRPQQKRSKQHKEMIAALKVGDEVASNGGLLGRVIELDDNFVTMEVSKDVDVKVQRHAVAQTIPKGMAQPT